MPIVVAESTFRCSSPDDAVLLGAWLVDEELSGVVVAGDTVTVPGLEVSAVIEIAETAYNRGWTSDELAAAAIAQLDDRSNHHYVGG